MSRHRNVRNAVYDDYDDDDYQYGHSVEDECISPTDAQQWIYDRAKGQQSMSEFLANNRDIEEEDDDELAAENVRDGAAHKRRDSECFQMPDLNDEDRARLLSCMDEIRDIVGETCSDRQMVEAIMKHDYDCSKALDEILNSNKTPPALVAKSGSKLTADTMEKDLKASPKTVDTKANLTPTSLGSARFTLPKVQFGAATGTGGGNLNDLVKQRMKQGHSFGKVLSDEPTGVAVGEKENNAPRKAQTLAEFAALSIGGPSTPMAASPAVPIKSFTNLSDLAKHHLEVQGTPPAFPANASPKFAVPQLFKKPFACASPPSALSGSSNTPIQTLSMQQPLGEGGWILDLKSALIKKKPDAKEASRVDKSSQKPVPNQADTIEYGFIDCDVTETVKPTIDEFCTIDISSVLERDLSSHRTMASSPLGVVLGVRYRKRKLPLRVSHHFPAYNSIERFRFDMPSPDDIVLGHIKKYRP